MAACCGVHVGNTSACIAVLKDGKVDVIANDAGERVTPAVVAFSDSEKVVGLSAKLGAGRNKNTVFRNKQFLGAKEATEEYKSRSNCPVLIGKTGVVYKISNEGKVNQVSPREIAVLLYKKMHEIATSYLHSEEDVYAVITVPVHFSEELCNTLGDAAESSGFIVHQIIREPVAAALAHDVGILDPYERGYCLVYRLGGASLDAALILYSAGMYTVVASFRSEELGGDNFTQLLADYLAEKFRNKYKLDPQENRRSMFKLQRSAETAKHVLSTMNSAHCFVESLCDGVDFSHPVTRACFESLISPVLSQYLQPVEDVLSQSNLQSKDISKVIMCGGSSRIPKIQKALNDMFSSAEILCSSNPEETIAYGAAKQGGFCKIGEVPKIEIMSMEFPCLTKAIICKVINDTKYTLLLPPFTPLPVQRKITLVKRLTDHHIDVELYETDDMTFTNLEILGRISLKDLPDDCTIHAEIAVERFGSCTVKINEVTSGQTSSVYLDAKEDDAC